MLNIKSNQLVRLTDDTIIDIRHVIVGIDVMNYLRHKVGKYHLTVRRSYDVVTWFGDSRTR